jgi:alpha-D-xyloside xylohydrolase
MVLDRAGASVVLEPYAPNIIRVNVSLDEDQAAAPPGYGFIATPSAAGWTHRQNDQGDVYQSSRLVVTVVPGPRSRPVIPKTGPGRFFISSVPPVGIKISTPEGETLLDMLGWSISVLNHKDGDADLLYDKRPSDPPFYQVSATFASPDDEHYYGLGQNQEGFLDHRGHTVHCWHDYTASGGPSIGIPFMVTNRGYGMIWDNPSKTRFEPGFNERTEWTSEVGNRVSFFVIAGKATD